MESTKENKMGSAPLLRLIMSMSLPAMFSMLIQALYNVVDSLFVAQISEDALTALSLVFPAQALMIAVAVGTGVGINSLVSRRLGEKRFEEANKAASHGIVIGIISWLAFAVLGIFLTAPFLSAFKPTENVLALGSEYMYIVLIFSFGVFVQINIEKTLQATGNMIYPMLFQLTGAITNIILDPILIFGLWGIPAMGVRGAAIATVAGQILALIFSTFILVKKSHGVKIKLKGFRFEKKIVGDIYKVGLPSIFMQSIASIMVSGLNAILISFSEAAVTVLGIYNKIQSFVFMPVFGMTQGVMPIMGYNYGARNKKRLVGALKIGMVIAIIIMIAGTTLFTFGAGFLLKLFNASDQLMSIGIPALQIIGICFVPAAIGITFSTTFQAVGNGVYSLIVSALRQLVLILPVAYFLAKIGLSFVWWAFPIAEFIALAVSIFLFKRLYDKKIKPLDFDKENVV